MDNNEIKHSIYTSVHLSVNKNENTEILKRQVTTQHTGRNMNGRHPPETWFYKKCQTLKTVQKSENILKHSQVTIKDDAISCWSREGFPVHGSVPEF